MAEMIEWKDYIVVFHIGKHDRVKFRTWLNDNNKARPYCPWENENANDCAYPQDYREFLAWKKLQNP
jgi:hypothetical protein